MVKVLWITNTMLPPVCEKIGIKNRPVGGWMFSSLKRLPKEKFKLAVATIWNETFLKSYDIDGIRYYLVPQKPKNKTFYDKTLEKYWKEIYDEFKADVVHVHGSEYPMGLSWVKANGNKGVVCSIQGLVSVCERYYLGGINPAELKTSIRDRLLNNGIIHQQKDFARRGKLEVEFLQSLKHIIGRTDWDESHSRAINPNAKYYYCGETLREPFYHNRWVYDKCEKHSIFASQAGYAIKGFHKLLLALPLVLKQYPDTRVYLTGKSPFDTPFYKIGSYALYIRDLIEKLELRDKVKFLGSLDETEMCNQFLNCNVFVCPSSIENSPNSLGEAQIMGVPHVASFVGGIPEIVEYDKSVLYRFDEHEMLGRRIIDIFSQGPSFMPAKYNRLRYDGDYNSKCLVDIYDSISTGNE